MSKTNDDKTNEANRAAAEAQTAHLSGQAPGQRAYAPGTGSSSGGYQVGDRVLIEAEVKAVTGDQLSLAVDRAPATDGMAPATTEGVTLQLSTQQVRKA